MGLRRQLRQRRCAALYILLVGIDENGREVTNSVTYLVLDILEELGISDFPTTVRLNRHTDDRLLRRVAEVMRYGGGILAVYNEDLIIEALTDYEYPLQEARQFANDGCWEVQIPGKTFFTYMPFDSLAILQQKTLKNYQKALEYPDFDALYQQFISDLQQCLENILLQKKAYFEKATDSDGQWIWRPQDPCTVVSLFEEGCIEKGLSYLEGGPVYNITSPHIGGLADTANSLYAIKKAVYDEKKVSLNCNYSLLLQTAPEKNSNRRSAGSETSALLRSGRKRSRSSNCTYARIYYIRRLLHAAGHCEPRYFKRGAGASGKLPNTFCTRFRMECTICNPKRRMAKYDH